MPLETPPAGVHSLWRLRAYLRPHLRSLAVMWFAALSGVLMAITVPLVIRAMIDGPIRHHQIGPVLPLGVLAQIDAVPCSLPSEPSMKTVHPAERLPEMSRYCSQGGESARRRRRRRSPPPPPRPPKTSGPGQLKVEMLYGMVAMLSLAIIFPPGKPRRPGSGIPRPAFHLHAPPPDAIVSRLLLTIELVTIAIAGLYWIVPLPEENPELGRSKTRELRSSSLTRSVPRLARKSSRSQGLAGEHFQHPAQTRAC